MTVGDVLKHKHQGYRCGMCEHEFAKDSASCPKCGSTEVEPIQPVYWLSPVGDVDDFGDKITDTIYDAPTRGGPWALMTQQSWAVHARSMKLGTGMGQRFRKQKDGKWLKVEG